MKRFHNNARTIADARIRLQRCGMGVIDMECLNPNAIGDSRIWHATTTRGERWIWWADGWQIAKVAPERKAA